MDVVKSKKRTQTTNLERKMIPEDDLELKVGKKCTMQQCKIEEYAREGGREENKFHGI